MKYRTDKQAEVGRLIAALGVCGRFMAGLPPKEEKVGETALTAETESLVKEEGEEKKTKDSVKEKPQVQNQGQGGGKKKKKGKGR